MMITNYQEFLVEKIIYQSLNESAFFFTKEFLKILKEIDSPISKFLIDKYTEDIPVISNYLDVDGKETISFISDAKAQRLLQDPEKGKVYHLKNKQSIINITNLGDIDYKDMLTKYGDTSDIIANRFTTEPESIPENQEFEKVGDINYYNVPLVVLKFDDKFILTWETNIKETPSPFVKNRQTIRVGRGIRAILNSLKQTFTDAEIEDFVNKWKAAWDWIHNEFRSFEIVSGEDIGFYYSYLNYEQVTGTLGNSCMREKPSRFFEIYAKNPEVCKLVILKSEKKPNKITGRALLWTLESGELFLDRIYTQEDSHLALFKKYAGKNGWIHKKRNGASITSELVMPDGSLVQKKISVRLKKIQYDTFPYLDTLAYLAYTKDAIILTNDVKSGEWVLSSVDGEKRPIICSYCSNTGRIQCETCLGEGNILKECGKCRGSGGGICKSCEGKGSVSGENCERCKQDGVIECDICLGRGEVYLECESCGGEGTYQCEFC